MPYVYTEEDPTVLMHYGRLGMKWGKHIFGDDPRWGKNGRGEGGASPSNSGGEKQASTVSGDGKKSSIKATNKARLQKAKKANQLSDQEINRTIDRLMREKQMKQLIESEAAPNRTMMKNILHDVLKKAATGATYSAASYVAYQLAAMLGKEKTVPLRNKKTGGRVRDATTNEILTKKIPPNEIEKALSYIMQNVGKSLEVH